MRKGYSLGRPSSLFKSEVPAKDPGFQVFCWDIWPDLQHSLLSAISCRTVYRMMECPGGKSRGAATNLQVRGELFILLAKPTESGFILH